MAGANASVVLNSLKTQLSWGGELHQCFVTAVQSLGGYFKATPKVGAGSHQSSFREHVWVQAQLGRVWASRYQRWRTLHGNEAPLPGILVIGVPVELFHIHARWPASGPMHMAR
jgi:SHAQKYF class myb-like DNA-binding protein